MAKALNDLAPVSYTHLDVYKRQVKTYVIRRLDRTGDECYATKEIPSKILGNPFCNIKNKEIEYFY